MNDNGVNGTEAVDADDSPQTVIVLVMDEGDSSHGGINVCSSAEKASLMIETLLEKGCEQDRIKVFSGLECKVAVAYRPVVTLEGARLFDYMPMVAD